MKIMTLGLVLLAMGARGAAQKPVFSELRDFRAPPESPKEHVKGFLWLEAEGFADYGDWRLDTQFTHKMGSAYLLAPGVGRPLPNDAKTTLQIPAKGVWRVWVRTKDWLPEHSPGRFAVAVNGTVGADLGGSKRTGWGWEKAGDFDLESGPAEVALKDRSGAFARCDALLFTTDLAYVPVEDEDVLRRPAAGRDDQSSRGAARRKFRGESETLAEGGAYDIVVVGSGTAGMGAALAAARAGARVALVHDRPVLGGNSSCELGIGTDGAAGAHPNRTMNARETGLCEEANLMRGRTRTKTLSAAYKLMAEAEGTLTVHANQRVQSVEKTGAAIDAVIARNTLTGVRTRYRAGIFIDCTGDGWVGVFADAARMYGREAQHEYNEWPAPEERDDLTMSGCLMDQSLCYSYTMRTQPVPFTAPAWADVLPAGFTRPWIRHIGPQWWIEHGGRFDDLKDPERARDELVRIAFAYWGWIKNASPLKAQAANAEITFVPYMNGRREGYRLQGDYVLTAIDALEGRVFPDRISYGGWPLDTHDPLGIENPTGDGYWKKHPGVPIYTIPYRCLYSRNVPNLMFAGRCQSVTHIALGSVRVEATLFTLGQAAGTAAALARAKNLTPRDYGARHIGELQQRLLKDDQYIPGLANADPDDLARTAAVSATSVWDGRTAIAGPADPSMRSRDNVWHELAMSRATCFVRGTVDRLERVDCLLASKLDRDVPLTVSFVATPDAATTPEKGVVIGSATGTVPARQEGFVAFRPARPLKLDAPCVWIVLPAQRGVSWHLRERPVHAADARAYGGPRWTLVRHAQYAFTTQPSLRSEIKVAAAGVIDGVSRPVGDDFHGWVSAPGQALPQSIRLDFPKTADVRQVRLTFDTDLTPTRVALYPRTLVRDYRVEGLAGGRWRELARVEDNDLRLRVHDFEKIALSAVRVTVTKTWGVPEARINEVRVY
ncbi:MAG: FAD-dependent oxidoreductase [Kiritimatiellia bacterium]